MPRGRQKTPKRLKREGEVWHKGKYGPHKKHSYVICMRCKRGISTAGFRVHARLCFGNRRRCAICEYPFPCDSKSCPWRHPEPPIIPAQHVRYFRRSVAPIKDEAEFLILERAAIRWLDSILKYKPWCDR